MSSYPEPLVARALGVSKKLLVRTRHDRLAKGADWALDERNQVAYSSEGLQKLCAALGVSAGPVEAAKKSGDVAAPLGAAGQGEALPRELGPVSSTSEGGSSFLCPAGQHPIAEQLAKAATFARRDPAMTAAGVAQATEAIAKKSAPTWIEVTGIPGNTIIVHGRLEGRPVTVRVRSNATFVPGLWVQATPLNGDNYFAMLGAPPRWKGDRFGFARPTQTTFPPNTGAAEKAVTDQTQSGRNSARAVKGDVSAQSAAPTLNPNQE